MEYSATSKGSRSDCTYEQADLRLCWSHIPHCWKSHALAHIEIPHVAGLDNILFRKRLTKSLIRLHRLVYAIVVPLTRQSFQPTRPILSYKPSALRMAIWAMSRENLSSGCPTKQVSNQSPKLQRLATKLKFHLKQVYI